MSWLESALVSSLAREVDPEADLKLIFAKLGIFKYLDQEAQDNSVHRYIEALKELTSGYGQEVEELFKTFEEPHNELVAVRAMPFYSLCTHHFLPFFGTVSIAYVPNGKVLGLSKFPRIVEVYSRRMQVQERMTSQIAETVNKYMNPKGVMVVSKARHMCMEMRGIESTGETVCSVIRGWFKKNNALRAEALHLLDGESK